MPGKNQEFKKFSLDYYKKLTDKELIDLYFKKYKSIAVDEIPYLSDFRPTDIGINTVINYGLYKTLEDNDWKYLLENTEFIKLILKNYKVFYMEEVLYEFLIFLYCKVPSYLINCICDFFNDDNLSISHLLFRWLKYNFNSNDYEVILSKTKGRFFEILNTQIKGGPFYDLEEEDEEQYLSEIYKIPSEKLTNLMEDIFKEGKDKALFRNIKFIAGLPQEVIISLIQNPEIEFIDWFFNGLRIEKYYLSSNLLKIMGHINPTSFTYNIMTIFEERDLAIIAVTISSDFLKYLNDNALKSLIVNTEFIKLVLETQDIIYEGDPNWMHDFFWEIEERCNASIIQVFIQILEIGSVNGVVNLVRFLIYKSYDVIPNDQDAIVQAFKRANLTRERLSELLNINFEEIGLPMLFPENKVPVICKYRALSMIIYALKDSEFLTDYYPIIKSKMISLFDELVIKIDYDSYHILRIVIEKINSKELLEILHSKALDQIYEKNY